ncbi:Lrp/AsnC family transcriptional regulator, leucine-responsive regulatory protein [Lutibacter agarilyticus]|uniref:Lrp/AsnC family transcriptional regulator, leucine-responsive regulatory protein n=1 Tax=Lutibacter agarilyticus TaxID=1109740 RepID=A0A238YHI2_9FLAO|nr:Lrp/AsnC family transcriptional regulator [Lutibacter agarilyticus]SNR70530.1 Lrp/AsnC family transcriptional regulator, leucine-responsive regulatory protein [Lutibacter agarilyticus]
MKLDTISWKILDCLQQNARQSNTEIARQVGITSPAVAERIKKMEDAGIIEGYHAKVSHFETGHQLKAIITLRAFMGRLKPFISTVSSFSEVVNCYRITGNENIVMEVVLNNQKHLEQFIDQLITYGETRTHIVLSNIVENNPLIKRIHL